MPMAETSNNPNIENKPIDRPIQPKIATVPKIAIQGMNKIRILVLVSNTFHKSNPAITKEMIFSQAACSFASLKA